MILNNHFFNHQSDLSYVWRKYAKMVWDSRTENPMINWRHNLLEEFYRCFRWYSNVEHWECYIGGWFLKTKDPFLTFLKLSPSIHRNQPWGDGRTDIALLIAPPAQLTYKDRMALNKLFSFPDNQWLNYWTREVWEIRKWNNSPFLSDELENRECSNDSTLNFLEHNRITQLDWISTHWKKFLNSFVLLSPELSGSSPEQYNKNLELREGILSRYKEEMDHYDQRHRFPTPNWLKKQGWESIPEMQKQNLMFLRAFLKQIIKENPELKRELFHAHSEVRNIETMLNKIFWKFDIAQAKKVCPIF